MSIKNFSTLLITILFYYSSNAQLNISEKLSKVDNYIQKQDFKNATIIIDSLKKTSLYQNENNKLAIDIRLASVLRKNDKPEEAISILLSGIESTKKKPTTRINFFYTYNLSKIYTIDEQYKKALYYGKKSLINAQNRGNDFDVLKSRTALGQIFNHLSFLPRKDTLLAYKYLDSSINYYENALKHKVNAQNKYIILKIYNNLSNNYIFKNLDKSLEMADKKMKLISKNDTIGYVATLNLYGNIFYKKKNSIML